jgi:predicted DNA-binding protein
LAKEKVTKVMDFSPDLAKRLVWMAKYLGVSQTAIAVEGIERWLDELEATHGREGHT